jgi:hypothetical protein
MIFSSRDLPDHMAKASFIDILFIRNPYEVCGAFGHKLSGMQWWQVHMDDLTQAFYDLLFENHFIKKKGNEFQDFFCEIMELRYPGDFMRNRPWGNIGDRKNDGYLSSRRMLFQVYAPNEMAVKNAARKIREDFAGAKKYWKAYFDTWVFTHNAREGLSPEINTLLLELQNAKPPNVIWWSYAEIRQELMRLDQGSLAKILVPQLDKDSG